MARFVAPMLMRSLLDLGGRNIYALVQMTMAAVSTLTIYRSVHLVWELREKAKEL